VRPGHCFPLILPTRIFPPLLSPATQQIKISAGVLREIKSPNFPPFPVRSSISPLAFSSDRVCNPLIEKPYFLVVSRDSSKNLSP
jgi:hypothetical protein